MTSLISLNFSFVKVAISPQTNKSLSKLKSLKELIIVQLNDETGTSIADLVDQLPNLEKLDISKTYPREFKKSKDFFSYSSQYY